MKNTYDPLHKKFPRGLIKTLRLPLPIPAVLARPDEPISDTELQGMNALLGSSGPEDLVTAIGKYLQMRGAGSATDEKINILLFDARSVQSVEGLKKVYEFFHQNIRRVRSGGRILIIGKKSSEIVTPSISAAQRALEGMSRTMAKETGHKGTTAQLIQLQESIANDVHSWTERLFPLVHFLLSNRSSFISGQVFQVNGLAKVEPENPVAQALRGKTALVTGAGRGIGAEAARVLAREGAKVIVLDIPQAKENAEKLASQLGGKALLLDVSAEEAPARIRDFIKSEFGGLDILVNNAGITRDKTLGKMTEKYWDQVLQINMAAAIRITEFLLDEGLKDHGRIIGISSISGLSGNFGQTNYAATKAGIIAYAEVQGPLVGDRGITSNAIAPGFIETDMTKNLPFTVKEGGRRLSNLKQGGLARDIAEAICFFSSPGSAGVTGQVIRVCGGSMIGR